VEEYPIGFEECHAEELGTFFRFDVITLHIHSLYVLLSNVNQPNLRHTQRCPSLSSGREKAWPNTRTAT